MLPANGLQCMDNSLDPVHFQWLHRLFRKMVEEQIKTVEKGGDPINVHRDPAKNRCITLATEHTYYPGYTKTGGPFADKPLVPPEVEADLK